MSPLVEAFNDAPEFSAIRDGSDFYSVEIQESSEEKMILIRFLQLVEIMKRK